MPGAELGPHLLGHLNECADIFAVRLVIIERGQGEQCDQDGTEDFHQPDLREDN